VLQSDIPPYAVSRREATYDLSLMKGQIAQPDPDDFEMED